MRRAAMEAPGEIIGIWRLGRCLSRGPTRSVYQAQPADAGASNRWPYVIRVGGVADQSSTERYIRSSVANRDRGLIPVIDGVSDSATPYVVTPALAGSGMPSENRSPILVTWAARQIAEAVASMHRRGWMHGDLREPHLLCNNLGHLIVIDLSSSTEIGAVPLAIDSAGPGGPPEYARLDRAVVAASDVFMLGSVLQRWLETVSVDPIVLTPLRKLSQQMVAQAIDDRPTMQTVADQLRMIEWTNLQQRIRPGVAA